MAWFLYGLHNEKNLCPLVASQFEEGEIPSTPIFEEELIATQIAPILEGLPSGETTVEVEIATGFENETDFWLTNVTAIPTVEILETGTKKFSAYHL